MRNVHVITSFSNIGGAEKMLARVLSCDSENEHLVVSLMSVSDAVTSLLPSNVLVVSLDSKSLIGLFLSIFKILPYINRSNKVFCWMYHANVIGTLALFLCRSKAPLIWGVRHSLDNLNSESFSTKVAIRLGKLLGGFPDNVIYCSKRSLQQHLDYGYSPATTAIYIPNGYLFDEFYPKSFNSTNLVLGAAGRFHNAKDFATFFDVAGKLQRIFPNLDVEVAGRNVELENPEVHSWIKDFGVDISRLTLHGELSNMSAFYRRVHFFALTSITEGFPNVLAEASSFGCICVSTDVGDASVIIDNSDRVVPIKGVAEMVDVLTEFMNKDSESLADISSKAAEDVRTRFDIKNISQQIIAVGDK